MGGAQSVKLVEEDNAGKLAKAVKSHPELVSERFEEEKLHGGGTLLHVAGLANAGKCVRVLVDGGADVDALDKDGWTPLHRAVDALAPEAVAALIECGADVTHPHGSYGGYSALILFAAGIDCGDDLADSRDADNAKRRTILGHLLKKYGNEPGLDINQRAENGTNILDFVTKITMHSEYEKKFYAEVEERLVAAGCVPDPE